MKVRALSHGQHNGRLYQPGEIFEIDGKPHPIFKVDPMGNVVKDKSGEPVVEGTREALAPWMVEVKDHTAPVPHEKKSFFGGLRK